MTAPTEMKAAHRRQRDDLTAKLLAVPDTRLDEDEDDKDRSRGWFRVLVVVALLLIAGVVYLTSTANDTAAEKDAAVGQRDAAVGSALSLAEQIRAACADGELDGALCASAAQVQADPIPGSQGRAGADGVNGIDGRNGVDGTNGINGLDGETPPCLSTPAQCVGADGRDGVDGKDGADGQDGVDGKDGVDGAPGRPPAGFSFTDGTGAEQTCTRDPGSPDESATYTCTSAAPGGGEPTSGMRLVSLHGAP